MSTTAADLKQQGNTLYADGKVEDAVLKYKEAIEVLVGKNTADTTMLERAGQGYTTDRTTVSSTVAAGTASTTATANTTAGSSPTNKPTANASTNTDVAILFSNASQCLIDLKRYDAAAASAASAVTYDPTLLKAWVRRVKATMAAGSRFEAFIHFYLNISPMITKGTKQEIADMMKIVGDLGDVVAESVGVSGTHAALALRRTMHAAPKNPDGSSRPVTASNAATKEDGGLSTVATLPIPAESVIFTEKQFIHPKLDAKAPNHTLNELSSETLIMHFSDQLVRTIRGPKDEAVALWTQFACVMRGSWPRSLSEISAPLAEQFIGVLREFHQKDITEGYVVDDLADGNTTATTTDGASNKKGGALTKATFSVTLTELTHMAVACRYNCFHSGFFRTCALANHSCNPNAAMKYVASANKVVMVAVRDIAPGEDITVKYLPDLEYVMGVSRRRELLYRSWLFWCDCGRCEQDLFDKQGSKHEWVKCQSCKDPVKGYAHLPNKGLYLELPDPSIPDSSKCFGCGAEVTLTRDQTMTALKTVDTLFNKIRNDQLTLVQMGDELLKAWAGAAELVHEEHWTHRVQLYCYCLVLGEMIQSTFNFIATKQLNPNQCQEILYSYGLADGRASAYAKGGGDVLVALLELWRRIESFYPSAQAWHLHLMIVKLACLNLLQPERNAVMAMEDAVDILAKHAASIGPQERAAHLRVLTQRKEGDKNIKWSPAVNKAIKKALA